jgi:hypothetical protein
MRVYSPRFLRRLTARGEEDLLTLFLTMLNKIYLETCVLPGDFPLQGYKNISLSKGTYKVRNETKSTK